MREKVQGNEVIYTTMMVTWSWSQKPFFWILDCLLEFLEVFAAFIYSQIENQMYFVYALCFGLIFRNKVLSSVKCQLYIKCEQWIKRIEEQW